MDNQIDAQLVENISVPVAYFDAEGMLVKTNRAWEMLMCEPSDALLILGYDDLVEQFRLLPFSEMQLQDISKTSFNRKTILLVRRRILMKKNRGIMVEVNDVTSMEDHTARIDSTITDTMWKIRSRVASVQNVLTLLVDYSPDEYSVQTGDLLSTTRREMWELSRHIEDLRDMTAINSGAFPQQIKGEVLDLEELLDMVRIECGPIVPFASRTTAMLFDVPSGVMFFSDRHICLKALSAVVFNALVYSDTIGPVRVTARREEETGSVRVTINDAGWGIPESEQDRIFSYGFRGARVQDANVAGLGVGLYLARTMLQAIGSEINFISKAGSGTQVVIIFREMLKNGL